MANQIPLSGATPAAGGILLPPEQGEILANGILTESGAVLLAGDARSTTSRRTEFPIWMGRPTAGPVGEGGTKLVTGAEFGAGTLNVKKFASIVLFTDEQIEDVQGGDLNVLVDSGVREALAESVDKHVTGKDAGTNITTTFDTAMRATTSSVEFNQGSQEGLRLAVSAAMGTLEANGYRDASKMGILLGGDIARHIRDARATAGTAAADQTNTPLYGGQPGNPADPLYGLQRAFSTNLNGISEAAGANKIVGFVVYRPNVHVRIRQDITVDASNQATVHDGTQLRNMWQENLTGVRYELRVGVFIHDLNRSIVAITNGS